MKLASLQNGERDGQLVVVSSGLDRALAVDDIAPHLLHALESWRHVEPALRAASAALDSGAVPGIPFDARRCMAPLPRCFQWCDASAFLNHGRLMDRVFVRPPIADVETVPVMYQGASDDFLGPHDDVPLPDEAQGIDFEGEVGVIVDDVPMGVSPEAALERIRLIVQLNDWSLRALGPREMASGFGFLQAKPSTSFAPVALTPDELGGAWSQGRVQLELHVAWNDRPFGQPHTGAMHHSFGDLIAHAARTRRLRAGTIIGSGTISNVSPGAGCACIAERRALELLDHGSARTPFMAFGDRVRMEARAPGVTRGPFGIIEQRIVPARAAPTLTASTEGAEPRKE